MPNLANDLSTFDGLEPVRITIGGTPYDVLALCRPLAPVTGEPAKAHWHLPISALGGATPVASNTLVTLSPGVSETWTIVAVEKLTLGSRFKLRCERTA